MNIKGLDYNTQREKLVMPEYGREIQKMVDHAIGLKDKQERQNCAQAIIKMMETKVPQLKNNADYRQTLWDHLYLMSRKQLDIDWPFDVTAAEKIHDKPKPIPLPKESIKLRQPDETRPDYMGARFGRGRAHCQRSGTLHRGRDTARPEHLQVREADSYRRR